MCGCILFYRNIYTHTHKLCVYVSLRIGMNRQSRDTAVSVSQQNTYRYSPHCTVYMSFSLQASDTAKAAFEMLTENLLMYSGAFLTFGKGLNQ